MTQEAALYCSLAEELTCVIHQGTGKCILLQLSGCFSSDKKFTEILTAINKGLPVCHRCLRVVGYQLALFSILIEFLGLTTSCIAGNKDCAF